jgi:hypothetical protein
MRDVDEDGAQATFGCLVYALVIALVCYGLYGFAF